MNAIHGATGVDPSAYATLETHAPNTRAPVPPPPPRPTGNTSAPPPPPSSGSSNAPPPNPTGCARQAAQPDPNYVDPKAKQLSNDAALVEAYQGGIWNIGANDGLLSIEDVKNAAQNPALPKGVREAAIRLLGEMDTLANLKGPDGLISRGAIANYVKNENTKGPKVGTSENPATGTAGPVITPPAAGSTPGADTSPGTGGTPAPPTTNVPAPGSSQPVSGNQTLDGAASNVGTAMDKIQAEITRLANESATSPEKAAANNGLIMKLQNQYQSLANLQNQLQTMVSNMTKLFSEISMNAIRNIR